MCLLGEDTDPLLRGMLEHEEGMDTVAILAGEAPVIVLGGLIIGPHGVDAILVEEGVPGALTEADDSTVVLVTVGGESCHAHPVEIRVVDKIVDLKKGVGLTLLHVKADHEGVRLDDDVATY